MIIWQGLGAAAFVIPIASALITMVVVQAVVGAEASHAYGRIIVGASLLISALLLHLLAKRLERRPSRTLMDKATGQEVTLVERHTMWFVPLRYWALLFAIAGVALILVGIFIGSD